MTQSALFDRLRPGLDPNDGSWVIVRYRQDWRGGQSFAVGFDATRGALQLAALAQPQLAASWLPSAPVTAPDGTLYRVDTERGLLLAQRACDPDFVPLPGLGGHGYATGRFDTPTGLAIDAEGLLYVADAGNGRVQVIDPQAVEVVAVLSDGLARPVHVALDADGCIFVADALTRAVHAFGTNFDTLRKMPLATRDAWADDTWTPPPEAEPRAIAVLADGTLAVFDPMRAELWHMTACGDPLASLPFFDDAELPPGWQPIPRRYAAEGEVIIGPLDGGIHDLAWHRVLIDADLPPGTALNVQTFADNGDVPPALLWAPKAPVPMPRALADRAGADLDRLVLAEQDLWPLWRLGRMIRDQPAIHRFEATGPVGVDTLTLPPEAARRLFPGDTIALQTAASQPFTYTVAGIDPRPTTIAASGANAAFTAPASLHLIARDGRPLPFGPLDLSFLTDPAALALAGLVRDGTPEPAALPHGLAAFLEPGDVVRLGPGDAARIEILEAAEAPATVHLNMAVEGDFSTSTLSLVASARRLIVREPLPDEHAVAPGTTVSAIDDVHVEQHGVLWIDAETGSIWLAGGGLTGAITPDSWTNAQFAEPRPTDRGRYLWLRLRLTGAGLPAPDGVGPSVQASATPKIRSVRVTGPRPSLLAWLPLLFSRRDPEEEPPGANFLERFLALFETQLTRIETAFESISRLLNPRAASPEWLNFVASWIELSFDPAWPIERRRQLVIEGAALQAAHGTPAALIRYLEIFTGASVAITEGFRARPPAPIELGARGALGIAPLGGLDPTAPDRFAHRFTVAVTLPEGHDREAARQAVRKIVETMKPAHAAYVLDTGSGRQGRIGIDTAVDSIIIPGPHREIPCGCDPDAPPGSGPQPGYVPGGFRLGGRLGGGWVSEIGSDGG